jgi:Spy/CpxP family protein refolding chaperone
MPDFIFHASSLAQNGYCLKIVEFTWFVKENQCRQANKIFPAIVASFPAASAFCHSVRRKQVMKKIPKISAVISLVLGAVFCLSLMSYAGMGPGGPGGPGPGPLGMHEGDRIIQMKDKIGLTDDQVTKIKKLFRESRNSIQTLMDQQKDDLDAVETKLKAKASDKELKVLLDALDADHQKIENARKSVMDQLRTILTPTQQAQSIVALEKRMENWKDKKGPGPGMRGDRDDEKDDK